jgi:hypothetical protein
VISVLIAFDISGKDYDSVKGEILKCVWRGRGQYTVTTKIKERIIIMTKMTNAATVFIPDDLIGNVEKIEVLEGDIPCRNIIAPLKFSVFVNKKRCVSKIYRN